MKWLALVLAAAAIVGGLVDNADAFDDLSDVFRDNRELLIPRANPREPRSPQDLSSQIQLVADAAVEYFKGKDKGRALKPSFLLGKSLYEQLTPEQQVEARREIVKGYVRAAVEATELAQRTPAGDKQVELEEDATRLRNKLTAEQRSEYEKELEARSNPKPATASQEPKTEPKRPDAPKNEEPQSTTTTPEEPAPQSDLAALLQLIHDREQELKARAEEKAAAAIDPLSGFYINAIECADVDSAYILKADPRVCDRYVRCAFGNKFVQFCDPGTAFDLETGTCLDMESVDCGDRKAFINEVESENDYDDYVDEEYTGGIQNLDICKKRNGYNKDPTQCRRYYRCQSGVMVQNATCPELTVFDDDNDNCRHPEETNRAECKPTDWYTFECPEFERGVTPRFGDHDRLAHPEDCTLYFSCLHKGGKPRLNTCPPPNAFDPETGKCEPYTEVKGCEGIYSSDYPEEEEEEEVGDRVARKRINGKFKEDSFENPFNKEERVEIFRPRYSQ